VSRILYFTRDYTTHDHRFLSAMAEAGERVYYLRLERQRQVYEDRPLPPEVEQVSWAGGQAAARWQDGPRLLASLKEVIRKVKPDLAQAGPLQRCAFLVALSGFQPLVSMSWGYDLIQDAKRDALWRWATRYTLRHSAAMVGDCETIRQLAISYGMPDERIVTFPWGVDLQHFSPASREGAAESRDAAQGPAPFTLLSTRGWEPVYGVDIIARGFVLAAQRDPQLSLIMLGNGSQAGALRQIFERGGVLERVHFAGQVRQADLPRYYRSCDLYVSASHSDGTSISLLEALACGCPVLLSDIPGNREWVDPGVQGWLFPSGDADSLAELILQAASDRRRLQEMGQAARRLAEQRADWSKNFLQLYDAYRIALAPTKGRE
jgi:glycosyltransferase involved in cell wall biosynthesis